MRFSLFHNFDAIGRWHEYNQVVREVVEIAQLAEQAGFWSIWYPEQHFRLEGNEAAPNAVMQSTFTAAQTQTIRIGQAANIITQWHPLRLAEDLALLDHMSNGRIEIGIGRGFAFEAINLNRLADVRNQDTNRALFEETLEILVKAWSHESFSHHGKFYRYPEPGVKWDYEIPPGAPELVDSDGNIQRLALTPRPLQRPHPPLWQPVASPNSLEWAASRGINAIMWAATLPTLEQRFALYREKAEAGTGRPYALGEGIALLRDVYVADTMEAAREDSAASIEASYGWILGRGGRHRLLFPGEKLDQETNLDFDFLFPRKLLLVGNADYVIECIHELKEHLNLEHLFIWSTHATLPHQKILKSIERFAERVMPEFQ